MIHNIIALIVVTLACILIPICLFGIVFIKSPGQRKHLLLLLLLGSAIYFISDWGVKEHLLKYLFNYTRFNYFAQNHYLIYIFFTALLGGILMGIPFYLISHFLMRGKFTMQKASVFGVGYVMSEAIMLVGLRSIHTIFQMIKNQKFQLSTTSIELYLSAYERLLIIIIYIGIIVSFVYLLEQNYGIRAYCILVTCYTLVNFLPGFFMAFSTPRFYEIYDRSVALLLIYLILTVAAISALIIIHCINALFKL